VRLFNLKEREEDRRKGIMTGLKRGGKDILDKEGKQTNKLTNFMELSPS
jgi:hypothetical protein